MSAPSRWNRFRLVLLLAAAAPGVALVVAPPPLAAQGPVTPLGSAGVGPRVAVPYTPVPAHFAGTRNDASAMMRSSGVTIHLSTIAVVLAVVILVILLV